MNKLFIFGLVAVLCLALASASPLSPSSTGANSATYLQNYQDLVRDALDSEYNVTKTFTNGSKTYLTTPEFNSSTYQPIRNLVGDYNWTTLSFTHYELRSDMFTEVGIALAMSNQTTAFAQWFNTLQDMAQCEYGKLPCWVVIVDGNAIYGLSGANDTAIDGSVRAMQALYLASRNVAFSASQRASYLAYANQLAADSYAYESISIAATNTNSGVVNRLPMGGGDCASFGVGCSVDMWTGYLPDIAYAYQLAYEETGNETYNLYARNVTAAFLQVSTQNDTDGDGFGVAPFNFNWDGVGSTLGHIGGGGVNSYHYTTPDQQWDDSDAPRFHMAGMVLYQANITNTVTGAYTELADYMTAWQRSGTLTSTTSCLQYNYSGSCGIAIQGGYYQNGFGGLLFLSQNTTSLDNKLDETLTHYSWSGHTFDSSTGGNALTYRGVRTTKLLGFSIGLAETSGNTTITDFTILWQGVNDTVTGGSATWYADLQTTGSRMVLNSSGIFLTNIQYTQSQSTCTASSLALTSGTYNTSTFSTVFAAQVSCPSVNGNTVGNVGLYCPSVVIDNITEQFTTFASLLGLIFIITIYAFFNGRIEKEEFYAVISIIVGAAITVAVGITYIGFIC